jgi:hypothetical protein
VGENGSGQTQNLIRDGTRLDEDFLLLDHVDQKRMLVQTEAVADTAGAEEDCVEEVLVCGRAIAKAFTCVEEKGDVNAFLETALFEPEELWEEIGERTAKVFLSDHVEAAYEVWV